MIIPFSFVNTITTVDPFGFIRQDISMPSCEIMMTNFGLLYEEWKPVQLIYPQCKYLYYISNFGRIYSSYSKRLLSGRVMSNGYLFIDLPKGNREYIQESIHRLVAMLFIPNYNNHPIVNHKDGNKNNNFFMNLEWCTYSHNTKHSYENNLQIAYKGEDVYNSKYTEKQIHTICKEIEKGMSNEDICRNILGVEYNANNATILSDLKTGHSWKHITCQYDLNKKKNSHQSHTDDELRKLYGYILDGYSNIKIMNDVLNLDYTNKRLRNSYSHILSGLRNKRNYKHIIDSMEVNI